MSARVQVLTVVVVVGVASYAVGRVVLRKVADR